MIAHGLNAQGIDVGSRLNPAHPIYFDPSTPPARVVADGAGVVRTDAHGASVTMLAADGSGIVRAMADGAAVTDLAADGAGVVRVAAEGAES